jgi:hypothetical protein
MLARRLSTTRNGIMFKLLDVTPLHTALCIAQLAPLNLDRFVQSVNLAFKPGSQLDPRSQSIPMLAPRIHNQIHRIITPASLQNVNGTTSQLKLRSRNPQSTHG